MHACSGATLHARAMLRGVMNILSMTNARGNAP